MCLALTSLWAGCYQEIDLGVSPEETAPADTGAYDAGLDIGAEADLASDFATQPDFDPTADLGETLSATNIAAGENTTCAVDPEGAIWCWGLNKYGILGTTEVTESFMPRRIGSDNDWKSVHVGDDQACATRIDDSLWCWGQNTEGQLARDSDMVRQSIDPLEVAIGAVMEFDTKNDHVCAVTTDQRLFCWGDNREAQIGQGDNEFSGPNLYDLPKEVIEPGPWQAVSVGDAHSCGLKVDGSIWCWGRNTQFAANSEETSQVLQPARQAMPPSGSWQGVSVGVYHSCAESSDSEWLCWGENQNGQIRFPSSDPIATITPVDRNQVSGLSANGFSSCGLDSEGMLFCWGLNIDGHIVGAEQVHSIVPARMTNQQLGSFTEVSVGRFHVCATDLSGRIWCAGSNKSGQLGTDVQYEDISTEWVTVPIP